MNNIIKTKLLILITGLLVLTPIIGAACQQEVKPATPLASTLATNLVPNTPLSIYLYAKQSRPTKIPAEIVAASQDLNIESVAVWGVPADDDFAFGMALALSSDDEAANVYAQITLEKDVWKQLTGNTVYLVYGSGVAADSLKVAISNNDFRPYDDTDSLKAAALLPHADTTKLAAIALAKPNKALLNLISKGVGIQELNLINTALNFVNLKVIAAGLYAPQQVDIAEIARVIDRGGNIYDRDLGLLFLIKSGLPGFIVKFAAERILTEAEFTKSKLGEVTIYKRAWKNNGEAVSALVRIEGNHIFIAVSGRSTYAETLINAVQVE